MERRHTDREYATELDQLREEVLLMGAKVEEMIAQALRAFRSRDSDLARRTAQLDRQIDELELQIDEHCLRILARWAPVASDLRFITTVLKLVTHLERAGDLAETICRQAIELNQHPAINDTELALDRMASSVPGMLRDALDAFVSRDAVRARNVIDRDAVVDAYYAQCFPELIGLMVADSGHIDRATRLQAIGKALERIGDQATNIAELVLFMIDARPRPTPRPRGA